MLLHKGVARLAAVVYFIQGFLGIAGISLPLYLRSQGFSVSKITFIASVAATPWFLKILYGAISDAVPLWRRRRKPYLIFCSILSSAGWALLSILPGEEKWLILSMTIANLGLAATDVITDALVVEYSRKETAQAYQGIAWGARSIGSIFSGLLGGILAAKASPKSVFLITSYLPSISIFATALLREKPYHSKARVKNILSPIVESFFLVIKGDLIWFIVFLLIISSSVAIGTPLFFFMRETLKFDEIFLGLLNSVTWIGATVGCFVFLQFFRRVPLRKSLSWAVGLGFVDVLLTLAIRSHVTAFLMAFFLGVLGYMVLLPLFSSAARLAHGTGVEGALYAVLMSWFNLGQAIASIWGGLLYDKIGLEWLIIVTAFLGLSAYLVVPRFKRL